MSDGSEKPRRRVKSFRDLIVWQKARFLVPAVYQVTKSWPRDEQFGLTAQVRRAVISIGANIAEGQGRLGPKEFVHHLSISHGSLCELQMLLISASDHGYLSSDELDALEQRTEEVGRMVRALMARLS
jgi:four helix bundle protein